MECKCAYICWARMAAIHQNRRRAKLTPKYNSPISHTLTFDQTYNAHILMLP